MNTKQRKLSALGYFKQELLKSKAPEVERIILFGSLAGGRPGRRSDIDIIVFARNPKRIEDAVDQLSFKTAIKYGESVEPIIYSSRDFDRPRSPFLQSVLQEGRIIYS